jgi:hypothetical protein
MEQHESESRREGVQSGIRKAYNISMGVLWTSMGVLFLGHDRFGMSVSIDPGLAAIFGGACVVYGLFRLWRGLGRRKG